MASLVVVNRMVRSSVTIQALRKVWIQGSATALIAEEVATRMRGERHRVHGGFAA
jgi:hypothetical protein